MKSIHRDAERGRESEWCLEHTRMSHIGFVHHHQHAQLTAIYIHCVLSPPSNLLSLTSCVKQNQIFTALLGSLSIMICSRCDIIESHMNSLQRESVREAEERCAFSKLNLMGKFSVQRKTLFEFELLLPESKKKKKGSGAVVKSFNVHFFVFRLEMECRNQTRVLCVPLLTFLQLIFVSVANARRFGLFTVCLF